MGLLSSITKLLTQRSNDLYNTITLPNPNPSADMFGKSVAISGDIAVVGTCETTEIGSTGTAYVYDLSSNIPTVPVFVLNHPDPEQLVYSDNFSWSLAMDEDTILVGAEAEQGVLKLSGDRDDYILVENSGACHAYGIAGGSVRTITNPIRRRTSENCFFGSHLAISGSIALVGTTRKKRLLDEKDSLSGKVYAYNLKTGVLSHTLTNPNPENSLAGARFGNSFDLYGDIGIVGAAGEVDVSGSPLPEPDSGKAYIYNLTYGNIIRTLENPNPVNSSKNDLFGYSVSIYKHVIAVGAPGEDSGSPTEQNNTGNVYVYDLNNNDMHTLVGPPEGQNFGSAVEVDEDFIVVGAPDIDYENQIDKGRIYVYERSDLTKPYVIIENPSPKGISDTDHFGEQISVSGNRIIANAKQERIGEEADPGNVYVFEIK